MEQNVWKFSILCIHKICPSNYCACRIKSCIVLFMAGLRMGQLKIFIGAHFPCILLLCAALKIIIWRPIFTKWFFLLYCLFLAKHETEASPDHTYLFLKILILWQIKTFGPTKLVYKLIQLRHNKFWKKWILKFL